MEAGREQFIVIAAECAMGVESRVGVLPSVTPIGKELWNKIRRRQNPITDVQYGGPVTIRSILTSPDQRRRYIVMDDTNVFGEGRSEWAERYFLLRPQFSNDGVPVYPYPDSRSDRGTLPVYHSQDELTSARSIALDDFESALLDEPVPS